MTIIVSIENEVCLCYNDATMEKVNLSSLVPAVADKLAPMVADILGEHARNVHSILVVGSAVRPDYNETYSDINSVVVLHEMSLKFIAFLAPLGKKYGKKRIAAPLIMTPEYIGKSLDVFPVEFLNYKLAHKTVYGPDLLSDLQIHKSHLRLQCERDIKIKLIGLRQGYLSSLGKKEALTETLVRSLAGTMAFFRAIIYLLGKEPPIARTEVIKALGAATGLETDVFEKLLLLRARTLKPSEQELRSLFERYYQSLESMERITDDLPV
jgi:predicted nucleotidyltransferase